MLFKKTLVGPLGRTNNSFKSSIKTTRKNNNSSCKTIIKKRKKKTISRYFGICFWNH